MIKKVTKFVNEEGFEFSFEPIEDSLKIRKLHNGYEARYLVSDENAFSPEDHGDDALFLVGYHRDFYVKSRHISQDQCGDLFRDPDTLDEDEREFVCDWKSRYHVFPLEAYIHGGVSLSLGGEGCFPDRRWDVSLLGCVFVSKDEWSDYAKAESAARSLVDEWNCYLSGDVYGCVVETYDKKKTQTDYDCCWGIYGHQYAMEELESFTPFS